MDNSLNMRLNDVTMAALGLRKGVEDVLNGK